MRLVRTIAALGAFPRLFAFFCEDCREAETIEDIPAGVQSMAPWSGGDLPALIRPRPALPFLPAGL
jgi:hypothetical protein